MYPRVLPGVDLEYEVLADALKENLVLANSQAGASWTFSYSAPGMSTSQGTDGTIIFRNAKTGVVQAVVPIGAAWDSASVPASVPVRLTLLGSGPNVRVQVSVDPQWLASPSRVWPVRVDPSVSKTANANTAYKNDGFTCTNPTCGIRIGNSQSAGDTYWRSTVHFPYESLFGKHILSSSISSTVNAGTNNCYTHVWYLVGSEAYAGYSTQLTANPNNLCATGTATGSALTSNLQSWASASTSNKRLFVRGHEAAGLYTYKQFSSTLAVSYNSYPGQPVGRSVKPCSAQCAAPVLTNSTKPLLTGSTSDPDGTPVPNGLRYDFEVWAGTSASPTVRVTYGSVSGVASGSTATWTVPTALTNGLSYEYRVRVYDQTDYGSWSSGWVTFTIDTTAPTAPTAASTTWPQGQWVATSNSAGAITWSDADPGVNSYTYWLDSGSQTGVPATTTSASLSGVLAGWHTFHLRAFDKAGNYSQTDYSFGLGNGSLTSPADQDRTQDSVTLSAQPTSTVAYPYVRYEWAAGTTTSWTPVPNSSLTVPGSGTVPTRANVTFNTYALASFPSGLTWHTVTDVPNDGLLQVRACFATSSSTDATVCTDPNGLEVARTAFGDSYATRDLGPGELSLLTGDLSVSASDASLATYGGELGVSRTATTLAPAAGSSLPSGVVGPGWSVALPDPGTGRAEQTLTDKGSDGYALLSSAGRESQVYKATTPAGSYPRQFVGVGDASDGSVLKQTSSTAFSMTDTDGTITTWSTAGVPAGTAVSMSSVTQPGVGGPIFTFDSTSHLITSVTGQSAVSCTSSPLTTAGCRSLLFRYGSASSGDPSLALPSGMYDVGGRLAEIDAVVTDPITSSQVTVPLSRYGYDSATSTGHLAGVWDPRISPKLITRYSYVGGTDRLASVQAPGQSPWALAYTPGTSARVASITRHDDDLNADAVTTVTYGVPWNGSSATSVGLPDLSSAASGSWGQATDLVANATAIFPPTHVPAASPGASDWQYAAVSYLDVNGRPVNSANFGAGAWQISATGYDQYGNVVRDLSADNRTQALNPTAATASSVAAMTSSVDRADALATLTTYAADGSDMLEEFGPVHPVSLNDGSLVEARTHVHNVYDQGAPSGGPFHLVTSSITSAMTSDLVDHDTSTTLTGYNALASGDGDGWALRQATTVTTVVPGGSNSTRSTRFNGAGKIVELRLPGGASTGGVGTDARSSVPSYYGVGASSPCNSVVYAGLLCQGKVAAQVGGSLPTLTTTTVTAYDRWQHPRIVEERDASGTLLRTTTSGYDAAGRLVTSQIVATAAVTPSSGGIPMTSVAYDPDKGLPTSFSSTNGTLTTVFDTQGRVKQYTDMTGNVSTTTYELGGRTATHGDGKGLYTYGYDNGGGASSGEHRGLLTSLKVGLTGTSYAASDTYSATYDAEGRASVALPNGIQAVGSWDNAGEETGLSYTGGGLGTTGLSMSVAYNSLQRKSRMDGAASSQSFSYTPVGELATATRDDGSNCISQSFSYDADSNRTGYGSNATCSAPATAAVHVFDAADRLVDTGTVYDQLGRTTTAASSTVTGGGNVGVQYYDNDMVKQLSQTSGSPSTTHTVDYTLDPSGHRIVNQTDSVSGTTTSYFGDSGDSPAWSATAAGWTRNIRDLFGLGAQQVHDNATGTDTVVLQLRDLTGHIIATVEDTSTAAPNGIYDYDPFGASVGSTPAPSRYGWFGSQQRAADSVGGLVLMGYRLYNPQTGRFLSVDPVLGGSANSYDYVGQDPINRLDLSGKWSSCSTHGLFKTCRQNLSEYQTQSLVKWLVYGVAVATVLAIFTPCTVICGVIAGILGITAAWIDAIDWQGHSKGVYLRVFWFALIGCSWSGCHRNWYFSGAYIWHR